MNVRAILTLGALSVALLSGAASAQDKAAKQAEVVRNVAAQIAAGSRQIFGTMIESHLVAGAQGFKPGTTDRRTLRYGQSITDACIGWDTSKVLLAELADAVRKRRQALNPR